MTTVFDQLEEFLPQHVSPVPSYFHATVAFIVAGIVMYQLGSPLVTSGFEVDNTVSENEARAKKYARIVSSILVGIFFFDTVYNISFKIRGFRANKKHFTYRHWFPKIYS